LASNEGPKESDDDIQPMRRRHISEEKNADKWVDAFFALGKENAKPLVELLRNERAPVFVQTMLADLLDPQSPPHSFRLKFEWSPRARRKFETMRKQALLAREIAIRIGEIKENSPSLKNAALADAVVSEFEKKGRGSRSYLHKCYCECMNDLALFLNRMENGSTEEQADGIRMIHAIAERA
jgi:hypothetical protein